MPISTEPCITSPLSIVCFNCRSAFNSVLDIQRLCDSHDIILLQEIWLFPDSQYVLKHRWAR